MKNKTYRFAAVAAVLLALALVFVAPVVATTDGEGEDTNPVYVAFIGEQGYEKLQYAIKNATEDDTIYLVGTISEGSFKLPATIKNITIDGQGTAVVKDTVINAIDGNSVDYQGLTIKNTTFENSRFVLGGLRTGSVIYKNLVFEGNTFKDIVDSNNMAAIHMNIASEENEYIENFRFVGNTIINVTGSSNSGVLMKNAKGDVIFEDNTISNVVNNAIQCINAKAGINLVIKNNRLSSNLGSVLNLYNVPAVTLEDNTFTLNEGQNKYYGLASHIGNTYYSNLQAVVDAAGSDDTITLLSNVELSSSLTIGKSIILDLNGKELSSNTDTIVVSGTSASLTIDDRSTEKTGRVTTSAPRYGAIWIHSGACVTLKSGTLNSTYSGDDKSYAVFAGSTSVDKKHSNTSFVMDGGKLEARDYGLCIYNGTATINGGSISANTGISGNGGDGDGTTLIINDGTISSIYHPQNGLLTINGGTITGETAVYFKSGSLTITGGELIGNGEKADYAYVSSGWNPTGEALVIENVGGDTGYEVISSVSISGGTFTSANAEAVGSYTAVNDEVSELTAFITGGTFSSDVSAYVAEDYHIKQVNDAYEVTNKWTVSFNSNGGSDVGAIEIENNGKVTQPDNPTKNGFTFSKWMNGETEWDFKNGVVTSDLVLNATWTENKKPSSSSSSSSSNTQNDSVEEPETPVEEPVAGEATVETEVTDGGEVALEAPSTGGSAAAADEEEAKVTGVVLPTGTEGKVAFVPISEQAAPEGKETSTKKVFEINIPNYEKGKAAVIKFQMTVAELEADGKTASEVALWHFDEETGEWTKLVTSYTIIDGVVYFEAITYDFSPFAIVYEDTPVDEPVDEPETPESPAPVLGVLAALGAAVVLRRK